MVSLNDLCDRPPRALADGEVIDLGGKRVRHIDTPHVPHNWEARVLFEETTRTLFCGDLFTHTGNGPPVTEEDIVAARESGRGGVPRELLHARNRPDDPPARRSPPDDAGADARVVVPRRLRGGARRPGRSLRRLALRRVTRRYPNREIWPTMQSHRSLPDEERPMISNNDCGGPVQERAGPRTTAGRVLDAWRAFLRCERRTWLRILGLG